MSQEYYSVEKNTNLGALNIGLQVFETITLDTVRQVEGIKVAGDGSLSMPGSKGPVEAKINKNNQLSVDVEVTVDYGKNVTTLINTLQVEVTRAIIETTGLRHPKINVIIKGVNF